jgi:hypothetical protein
VIKMSSMVKMSGIRNYLIVVHAPWEAINKKLFNLALLHCILEQFDSYLDRNDFPFLYIW